MPRSALNVVASGSGPPVLLLHGAGGTLEDWPPEARVLPGRRVLAVDLPGHGGSTGPALRSVPAYAAAVAAWCEEAGLAPALVAGHSMGGAIALWMALEHPGLVSALGLVSTGARLRVSPDLLSGFSSPSTFPAAVETLVAWEFGPAAPPALREAQRQGLLATGPVITHGDFTACDAFDVRERLGRISVPALVLCGAEDRLTPPRLSQALAGALAAASLELVAGAGHMLPLEAPAAVATALAALPH